LHPERSGIFARIVNATLPGHAVVAADALSDAQSFLTLVVVGTLPASASAPVVPAQLFFAIANSVAALPAETHHSRPAFGAVRQRGPFRLRNVSYAPDTSVRLVGLTILQADVIQKAVALGDLPVASALDALDVFQAFHGRFAITATAAATIVSAFLVDTIRCALHVFSSSCHAGAF